MNVQKMFTLQLTAIVGDIMLLELNAEIVSGIVNRTNPIKFQQFDVVSCDNKYSHQI